jgi:dienelactone hydrolase
VKAIESFQERFTPVARFGPAASLVVALLVAAGCAPTRYRSAVEQAPFRSIELHDAARTRTIPVAVYGLTREGPRPLAVVLPGYGISNTEYGFVARELVARGYIVAAIQQQLATDPPVPGGDNLLAKRRPYWQRGAADIRFVAQELRRRKMASMRPLALVGHSHGGDTIMLFATESPKDVAVAFSLDNRRMPLPRVARPRVCSARSVDQSADPGVLPSASQQAAVKMVIAPLAEVRHDEMSDAASDAQKRSIVSVLRRCLGSR